MPSLRLFFAVETPPEIRSAIAEVRDALRTSGADVRWESAEKFHITLRFLGDVDSGLLPVFVTLLEGVAARRGPIGVSYGGLGCFPHRRDPRVFWVGVDDPSGSLTELQREVEDGCRRLGMTPEAKEFHAHVTIGRVRGRRKLDSLLAMMESATLQRLPATIGSVCLVQSTLQPAGSVYTTLHRCDFRT